VQDLVVAENFAVGLIPQSEFTVYRTQRETGDLSDGVATANCVSKPLFPLFVHVFPESLLQLYSMAKGLDFHLKMTCVSCESIDDSVGAEDESMAV
jgi:hypothetical protein